MSAAAGQVLAAKRAVLAAMRTLVDGGAAGADAAAAAIYHPDALWRGPRPLGEARGVDAIAAQVWRPLLAAFPDLERRDLIVMGGTWRGDVHVAALGHLLGRSERSWLGLPTLRGGAVYIRYGEWHRLVDGKVAESMVLFDVLDVIRQLGAWPLPPMLGSAAMWPGPLDSDGIIMEATDAAESAANLEVVLDMHRALQEHDDGAGEGRAGLLAMGRRSNWHAKMAWYGPAGIGTCRGLEGFVDVHQLPFRRAFPNRDAGRPYLAFGDGRYVFTGGWDTMHARHLGPGWLGLPPSGREVRVQVMDFYRNDGGLIRENWVPLDVLDMLHQLGCDVFAKLAETGRLAAG